MQSELSKSLNIKPRPIFKYNRLHAAIMMACAAMVPAHAQAQTSESGQPPVADEEVVVTGQADLIRRALADERKSDNLKSIKYSDDINALPDINAAESLQRLPGLSIERDQGEGRFVRIRGISPDLNNTTINGVRVLAPEEDRRSVALDVIPSGLVDSLVVSKALTPDMDGDTIGGNVDVKTVSALDRRGPFFKASGGASYTELTDETDPKIGLSGGDVFEVAGGRLGVAAAFSFDDRNFGSDNIEADGNFDFGQGEPGLEEIEERDYKAIGRRRLGFGINIDFETDLNNTYYVRSFYSDFEDDEERDANTIEFSEALAEGAASGALDEFEREGKQRTKIQEILSLSAGAEHILNKWTLSYEGSYSEATELEEGDRGLRVEGAFTPETPIQGVSFSGTRTPLLNKPGNALDPENFQLDEVNFERVDNEDEEIGASLDIKRDFRVRAYPASAQFGAKVTRRTKERDTNEWLIGADDFTASGIDASRLGLENFSTGAADWPLGAFGPSVNTGLVRDLAAEVGPLENFVDDEASRVEDFEIDEDINAAYAMGTIDINRLRLVGGVRYEDTDQESTGTRFNAPEGSFETSTGSNDYDNVLPSLNARYELTPDTLIRASYFRSIARPIFEQLAPSIIIEDDDEVEFGNPDLDPAEADSLGLGIEHYFSDTSAVSAHLFYKDIDDLVFQADLAGTGQTRRGLDLDEFSEAETFDNAEGGEILGIELAGSHQFSDLPGMWRGLFVNGNVALSDSEATISGFNSTTGDSEQRDIDLPRQSDVTANLSLGYEYGGLSTRLAGSFKSEHLLELGDPLDETGDIYEDDHFQLDLSSKYNITEQFLVTFEAINLNDREFFAFQNEEAFNAQFEEYGRTFRLGLAYTMF